MYYIYIYIVIHDNIWLWYSYTIVRCIDMIQNYDRNEYHGLSILIHYKKKCMIMVDE